jgi:hypothetical protein
LVSLEGKFDMVLPLIWAISNGSKACIQQIMVQRKHVVLEPYLNRASSWFFGSVSGDEISGEMLTRLHDFSFDVLPPSSEWWGWLYYRIIVLARLGDKLLRFLLECIHQCNDLTGFLCGHLIWEAAGHAQVFIAKEVIDFMRHHGSWPKKWVRVEHKGQLMNALERAAMCDCEEMVSLLVDAGCVMFGNFKSSTLQKHMIPSREPIRDGQLIAQRLRIFEVADKFFQEVEAKMPFPLVSDCRYSEQLMMCLLEMLGPEMRLPHVNDLIWKVPMERVEAVIESLLNEGVIPAPGNAEWLLFDAIRWQKYSELRGLIDAGVSLSCREQIENLDCEKFWLKEAQFVGFFNTVTPLLYAVLLSDFESVKLILESNDDVVNHKTALGRQKLLGRQPRGRQKPQGPNNQFRSYTALQLAASFSTFEIFTTLLDYGADPKVLDDNGRDMIAFIYRYSRERTELVEYLCYQNFPHWAPIARRRGFGSIVDKVENAVLRADKGV